MPRGRPRKEVEALVPGSGEEYNRMVESELNQQSDEEAHDYKDQQEVFEQEKRPRYVDPEWHNFVMSQFVPEELDPHGNPKIDGLRRVAEGLLGEIVESRPVQSSSNSDGAAVNWILIINWACDNPYIDINNGIPLPTRTFGSFVDASRENCKPPFDKFLASMACTRAESKTLRKALRLRCIAAEEAQLGEVNTFEEKVSDGSYNGAAKANDQQKMMVLVISERLKIDINKLVDKTFPGNTMETLSKEQAANIIVLLNKMQTSVKEGSTEIPEDIKIV